MIVARPRHLDEALELAASVPDALLLAGGTDLMVAINGGAQPVHDVVCLRRVAELRELTLGAAEVVLGAGLTHADLERELPTVLPALAQAARTVGSRQIRNAGTLGGNLGTASPAGDLLPVLVALRAEVMLQRLGGSRSLPVEAFLLGVKRADLQPGEIIRGVRIPRPDGPQEFLKVGTRNAMVIALANCAVVLDTAARSVRCVLGAVGPTPIRAAAAERLVADAIDWPSLRLPAAAVQRFGELAAEAARPITDHRGTADYRRYAVAVIARRGLERMVACVN